VAGVEAFTILAILDAKDRISGVMERVDETLNGFATSAERAAEAARVAGTAIDESLLQTASGADALEVAEANLSATQSRLALATQELAGAERELLAANDAAARSAEGDAVAMSNQSAAAERLAAAQKMVRTATAEVAAATRVQAATADAAAASAAGGAAATSRWGTAAAGAGVAMRTAGKFAMGAGVAAAAVAYESVKAATSFQTLTTRLVTSAGESKSNLDLVKKGILDISASVGVSADEAAKGMYTVESAGYHGAAGLKVLRAATEGAAIEGADFATVSNAVTDVLQDYHWSADKATTATSALIKGVSYGKTNFQNLASSMANVLPMASAYHIKLNDVVGVLSQMTAHGMTAARASFNIANAMRNLATPTGVMTKELKLFGLSAHDVQTHLDQHGLAGTLQWLSQTAKKGAGDVGQTYNEALKKLTGSATALQVALLTTGENAKGTNKAVAGIGQAMGNTSGHVEGFAELQQTMAYKMDKAKAAIHNAGIAIGSALLPAVTKIAGAIARVLTPIAGWVEKHQKLTAIILGSLIGLGLLVGIVWALAAAVQVLLSPITLIVLGIAAVVAIVVYAYNHFKTFRTIMNELGSALKTGFVEAWKAAGAVVDWFSKNVMPYVKEAINGLFKWFSSHKEDFQKAWDTLVQGVKDAAKWFNDNVLDWIRARIKDLTDWWHSHSKEITQVWHFVFEFIKTEAKVAFEFVKAALNILYQGWKVVWGLIKDAVKLVWGAISDAIKFAMHLIMNTIGVILDVITGHWGKAWKDVKKLASQALSDTWNFIKHLFSNAGTLLWDAGKNIIKGLISGIKSMVGAVGNAIGDVVSEVKDHLPWSPAKKGPLSGAGAPEIGGRNIVKMLSQGIKQAQPQVEAAMTLLMNAAKARQSMALSHTATAGLAGGLAPGNTGAAGGNTIIFDLRESRVMSDRDMDLLVNKIGRQIATRVLPAGGVRIRM